MGWYLLCGLNTFFGCETHSMRLYCLNLQQIIRSLLHGYPYNQDTGSCCRGNV
jgi:hypothetical protein